jgi:hypothetical protein
VPREVHIVKDRTGSWSLRQQGDERVSVYRTQAEAARAGRALAANRGGGEVVIHRADGRVRDRDTVPASKLPATPRDSRRASRTEGPRTTLRVPEELARTAEALARELRVSRNDALVRLATRGARQYERERRIAEQRDRRWHAVLASLGNENEADFPPAEVARAAVLAARDDVDEPS